MTCNVVILFKEIKVVVFLIKKQKNIFNFNLEGFLMQSQTMEKLNRHLQSKPIPGHILLCVETLTFKCMEANTADKLLPEAASWVEGGGNAKVFFERFQALLYNRSLAFWTQMLLAIVRCQARQNLFHKELPIFACETVKYQLTNESEGQGFQPERLDSPHQQLPGSTVYHMHQLSKKQAEYFIANQALMLSHHEGKALAPNELQQRLSCILSDNPDLAEAHFLSYINSLRVKEYCTAIHSLYHYFDRKASMPVDTSQNKKRGA
ncbi:Anaphase-promoting complex subunit 5 [Bulinus truncatus]|nr:Anaphase-promoting complex subunit 5 [Bulinus truncatus]